ncbi:hypothetical protein [Streptomyces sp. NPDC015125]|uniref:hypothetical protein n=1 Tax=Streptomyces sp. NPDC015125 TaxID=3364938 RepID=UPI0036FE4239
MPRATRVSTIRRHLAQGGLVDLELDEATQKASHPTEHETDGFAARQHVNAAGTLIVLVGAYGPDWFTTMREVRHRLEQPYVKCTVDGDASGLGDHEVLAWWATSKELQARKRAQAQQQAPLLALLRKQDAAAKAAAERRALEDSGQAGLW